MTRISLGGLLSAARHVGHGHDAAGPAAAQLPTPAQVSDPPHQPDQPRSCPPCPAALGSCSLAGSRYGALNQDYVVTRALHSADERQRRRLPQLHIALVLDGHGLLGERAARQAGDAMLACLERCPQLRRRQLGALAADEVEAVAREAFEAGHAAALRVFDTAPASYTYPLGNSQQQEYQLVVNKSGDKAYTCPCVGARLLEFGTSATLVLVQGDVLAVASVGDSLAVLAYHPATEGQLHGARPVSVLHKASEPAERQRLEAECGGAVSVTHDGYLCVDQGRLRNFQLAMSRALGHRLLAHYGVTHRPSVLLHRLHPVNCCLMVATDGVWDVLSPHEAAAVVCEELSRGRDPAGAAHTLCSQAVALAECGPWRSRCAADNTTAAVFDLGELG